MTSRSATVEFLDIFGIQKNNIQILQLGFLVLAIWVYFTFKPMTNLLKAPEIMCNNDMNARSMQYPITWLLYNANF